MITQTKTNNTARVFDPLAATVLKLARTIRMQMLGQMLIATIESLTRSSRVWRILAIPRKAALKRVATRRSGSPREAKYVTLKLGPKTL